MLESKSDVSGLGIFSITPVAQRAGLTVKVPRGFLASIRCVYKISWSVCAQSSPCPRGHGAGWAWSCGCCWCVLVALDTFGRWHWPCQQTQQHSCSLEFASSWDPSPDSFPVLFSGSSSSICLRWYLQNPLAQQVLLSVEWVRSLLQNSSPALISALQEHPLPRCLEPCTWQQLAVPWQVLELSFVDIYRAGSFHLLFTEVLLLYVQQKCHW